MQPAIFVGHGSPMKALEDTAWSRALTALGQRLRPKRPRAVVVISAHWETNGTFVQGSVHPKTIHDFGGFPDELYQQQYPAPGDPTLAQRVADLIPEAQVTEDWGLDHGAWTVLKFIFPHADLAVLQVSLDRGASMAAHMAMGKRLRQLQEQGVLLLGSGNIVHNLRESVPYMRREEVDVTLDWAQDFDDWAWQQLQSGDHAALADPSRWPESGALSVPTREHYLPLLWIAGAANDAEVPTTIYEGMEYGGLSMRSFGYGLVS